MRVYFHLIDDTDVPDQEGVEVADLGEARARAVQQARGLIGEQLKIDGRIVLSHRIDIEDEHGAVLDTLYFRDLIRIEN